MAPPRGVNRGRLRNGRNREKVGPGGVYRSRAGNIGRYEVELRPRRMEGHRESHGFLHESSVYREAFHPAGAETPLLFR